MSASLPDAEPRYQRPRDQSPIRVDRWPSEMPLLFIVAVVSLMLWGLAAISIIGLVYAAMLGVFFFVVQVAFVAHVRGSGVRLGPDQFPEIHAAVESLATRMGFRKMPEVYLMQAGGTLNAFAAKFLRSNIVVLFSDLVEACGDDEAARDMIIAHELGHIHAGHLRWAWFLIPGSIVPFLGTALSRAREYTCDRYGLAGAGRRDSALLGLAILAAGGKHGARVNREAMVRQREQLNTGWMRIGEWLSTHPPLVNRLAALDPALDAVAGTSSAGSVRAVGILATAFLLPVAATVMAAAAFLSLMAKMGATNPALLQPQPSQEVTTASLLHGGLAGSAAQPVESAPPPAEPVDVQQELTTIKVKMDLESLANVVEREKMAGVMLPTADALYAKFVERNPGAEAPRDPWDGQPFGYEPYDGFYILRSAGPDKTRNTADDVIRDSRVR